MIIDWPTDISSHMHAYNKLPRSLGAWKIERWPWKQEVLPLTHIGKLCDLSVLLRLSESRCRCLLVKGFSSWGLSNISENHHWSSTSKRHSSLGLLPYSSPFWSALIPLAQPNTKAVFCQTSTFLMFYCCLFFFSISHFQYTHAPLKWIASPLTTKRKTIRQNQLMQGFQYFTLRGSL